MIKPLISDVKRIKQEQNIIQAQFAAFDDTTWSFHPAVLDSFNTGRWASADIYFGGQDVIFQYGYDWTKLKAEIADSSAFTDDKPTAIIKRIPSSKERSDYSNPVSDGKNTYLVRQNSSSDGQLLGSITTPSNGDEPDYIEQSSGLYCHYLTTMELSYHTADLGRWQIHFHPEIWFYPRDPFTGNPVIVDQLKMGPSNAQSMKSSAINSNDMQSKYYKNPYLSDSASVSMSFAFTLDPGPPMNQRDFIWLSGAEAGSKVVYEHYPTKMYRVNSNDDIEAAVRLLYSSSNKDELRAQTIDERCPCGER